MGLFESKDSRVKKHMELLGLAQDALRRLKVEPLQWKDEGVVPHWKDPNIVPLEFRSWIQLQVRTLVFHVHDTEAEKKLGDREYMNELAEALSPVRMCLAGVSTETRDAFRAELSRFFLASYETRSRSSRKVGPFSKTSLWRAWSERRKSAGRP